MSDPGKLITLEGIEGVGKSTAAEIVAECLRAHGLSPKLTREPGGTEIGEKIRDLLLAEIQEPMADDTELLLILAARAQHWQRVLQPTLANGDWVICDRFIDATLAYQGYGRGISLERIFTLQEWLLNAFKPHLTLLFDAPETVALQRLQGRKHLDRFEAEELEFFQRVRAGYLQLAEADAARFRCIDASRNRHEVQQQLQEIINSFLEA